MSNFVELSSNELIEVDGGNPFLIVVAVVSAVSAFYSAGRMAAEVVNQGTGTCPTCGGNVWW